MKLEYDDGFNPNTIGARENHPGFKERIIFFDRSKVPLEICPHCQGQNLELFGTMQRCYQEDWEQGRLIKFHAESEEVRHLEIIVCLTCDIIWFVKYEEPHPESSTPESTAANTTLRNKAAVSDSSLSPESVSSADESQVT